MRNIVNKYLIYPGSAFSTGIIGALIILNKLCISPEAAFSHNDRTANIIFILVIGLLDSIEVSIVGTIVLFLLREFVPDPGTTYTIFLGAVAVLFMLKTPEGIWGLVRKKFDIYLFPVRRKLILTEMSLR